MSTIAPTLSVADRLKLRRLCKEAYKRRAFVTRTMSIYNYDIMLRHSAPRWPANGLCYETLDVVQIGYTPYANGECELENIPKRGAVPLIRALEECCREKGVSLRIECVSDDILRQYYITEHGFILEGWGVGPNFSTSVIKPLDAVGKEYKFN